VADPHGTLSRMPRDVRRRIFPTTVQVAPLTAPEINIQIHGKTFNSRIGGSVFLIFRRTKFTDQHVEKVC
jgi:hypothetical protein